MRTVTALLAGAALALALPPAAAAATRPCPQSDPANGITALRAGGLSCRRAFAVAERTNAVKCFLNGSSCTHELRGRTWRCRLTETATSPRVRCTSGGRVVRYRIA